MLTKIRTHHVDKYFSKRIHNSANIGGAVDAAMAATSSGAAGGAGSSDDGDSRVPASGAGE